MPMADSEFQLLDPHSHKGAVHKTQASPTWKDHRDQEQASENAIGSTGNQSPDSETHQVPAIYLPRQVYIIWLVLAYSAILCTAWIILAWTSKRPFGRSSYNCYNAAGYCRFQTEEQAYQNERTLRYIADAQTLLSAVALLTIPLTSAVCAAAVVPWLQRSGQNMSVRQLITLVDKGWTSPYVYSKLVSTSGWRRYGSSFIALALLLNALGASLSPAITRLASLQNIKVPTNGASINGLVDVDDLVTWGRDLVLPLRDKLSTGQPSDYVPRMWQHVMPNCSRTTSPQVVSSNYHQGPCDVGGLTFETLADAPEAWMAQLPGGFNTGVKTNQVVPRINSSASVDRIDSLPEVCNGENRDSVPILINHAGQAYEYIEQEGGEVMTSDWWVKVCVPAQPEVTSSSLAKTNDMQTIQETAYIEVYSNLLIMGRYRAAHRISVNTTVGNFQLPNYILNNRPGPLQKHWSPTPSPFERRAVDSFPSQHNSTATVIDEDHTPGPLLTIIYALFGDGSLPAIYSETNTTYKMMNEPTDYNYPCLLSVPLYNIAEPLVSTFSSHAEACLRPAVIRNGAQMYGYLYIFNQSTPVMEKVFRAASYMYHDVLFSQASSGVGSGRVEYDAGADLQKPALSDGSIIGLTIVIAVFLTCLLSLALYASLTRTWTSSLDAYAMIRIGAELGPDAVPFLAVKDPDVMVELDELPGWVGNVAGREEKTGVLGLGYNKDARELDGKEKYKAYDKRWRRGKWRMFEYYLTGIFSCWGRRNTRTPQKARNLRKVTSMAYWWITWPVERLSSANQRYQSQFV